MYLGTSDTLNKLCVDMVDYSEADRVGVSESGISRDAVSK